MAETLFSFPTPFTPPTTEEDRLSALRLIRSRRVGPATYHRLIAEYGSAAAALAALPDIAQAAGVRDYRPCPRAEAEVEIAAAARAGAWMLCHGTQDYPAALAALSDAPPVLWCIGDAARLSQPAVALVGARNASSLGQRMARALAGGLGAEGYCVVSGLARGIDACAHAAALETGTIALLAGGVDVIYPPENATLAARIAEVGMLLSEAPMGLQPQARHFPGRNRIISGLALGVVVVEAAVRSGSLITARDALDQGREVMAVPGHPFDARASGCNALLRDGATLVRGSEDVCAALAARRGAELPGADDDLRQPRDAADEHERQRRAGAVPGAAPEGATGGKDGSRSRAQRPPSAAHAGAAGNGATRPQAAATGGTVIARHAMADSAGAPQPAEAGARSVPHSADRRQVGKAGEDSARPSATASCRATPESTGGPQPAQAGARGAPHPADWRRAGEAEDAATPSAKSSRYATPESTGARRPPDSRDARPSPEARHLSAAVGAATGNPTAPRDRAAPANPVAPDVRAAARPAASAARQAVGAARPPIPRPAGHTAPTAPAPPRGARAAPDTDRADEGPLRAAILARLSPSPLAEDQLIRDLARSAAQVAPVLLLLELEGRVLRQPGALLSLGLPG